MCAHFNENIARSLYPCSPDQAFRFRNGERARHVAELRDALEHADPDTIEHHRDDLGEWIATVARDPGLAKKFNDASGNDNLKGHALREKWLSLLDDRIAHLADDADMAGIHAPTGPRARRLRRSRPKRRGRRR